jgi:formate hydrogenlyase subunit 4
MVAVALVVAIVVMVPVFIIGVIADGINRWVKERDEERNGR